MKVFFTADTHFGHSNILRYCQRPFGNVDLMNAALVANWNAAVGKDDTVYHLGDFGMCTPEAMQTILDQLNGHILLIRGSHDRKETLKLFIWVPYMFMKIAGYNCLINHRPIIPHGSVDPYRDNDPHLSREIIAQAERVVCGHCHNKWVRNGINLNIGVDVNNFYPVSIDEVAEVL